MTTKFLTSIACKAVLPCFFAVSFTGCGDDDNSVTAEETTEDVTSSTSDVSDSEFTNAIQIVFSQTSATVTGSVSGVTTSVSGAVVTITSTASNVNYQVSGTTTDGGLDITSDQPLMITLNGAGITRSTSAPISVASAVATYVKSVSGSTNKLTDGTSNTSDGTLYTAGTLTFSGAGTLTVTGNTGDAVHAAGNVTLAETALTIAGSVDDGIQTKGSFAMTSGTLTITSTAQDVRGVNASASSSNIEVSGGTVNVTVSGDQSKGFRSKGYTTISGGSLTFTLSGNTVLEESGSGYDPSYCTAFKTAGDFTLSGGTVTITASGKGAKGISPDGSFTMTGGELIYTSSGSAATYTNTDGEADAYSSTGISSDGECYLYGGTINISATGEAGKGISADSNLIIGESTTTTGPTITVKTSGSKLYVSGSGDDADYSNPKAIKSDADVTVNSGTITVTCTQDGGEGLESKATLNINGGTLTINTVDDCINATTAANFNGGKIYCYASGNDAIDSNGTISVSGGLVIAISAASSPETGIDCDQNTFAIKGGTLIGVGGASHSSPTSSATTQRTVHYSGLTMTGGQLLAVNNSSGTNLMAIKLPSLNYTSGALLFSSSDITSGTTYTIYRGGSYSGSTSDFNGYYTGGTYTTGTSSGTFTSNSVITTAGSSSGR